MFASWQAILSSFDFDIEFIKGENNSLSDFLTREFLQGRSDKTPFMHVFTMSKKYNGKDTQTNDDYKIVPTKHSFQSLANFPPLPYKTVLTKPPTKPSRDNYFLRYTEHLFLTSYKVAPTNLFIQRLGSMKIL